MTQLRLEHVSRQAAGGTERLVARVREGAPLHELYLAAAPGTLGDTADPWLPSLLLRGMRAGADVVVEPPVSARLLAALPRLQDIFCSFEPALHRVDVRADTPVSRAPGPARAASFFSGGVDSFFTALKHRDQLGGLLFVHGFDIPLANHVLREQAVTAARAAAGELGLPLVEIEMNLRSFLEDRGAPARTGSWGMMQGGALAATALALAPSFGRVLIPSGAAYGDLHNWGTHPLIDPLWSTESVQIEHDGCEARRLQKVEAVARHPGALRVLRVCFKNPGGAYNCGRCDKCVRTMVQLRAQGALDRCTTFEQPLDLRLLDDGHPLEPYERNHLAAVRSLLQATGRDPELLRAVDRRLRRSDLGRRAIRFVTTRVRQMAGVTRQA